MSIDPVLLKFAAKTPACVECDPTWSDAEIERRRHLIVDGIVAGYMSTERRPKLTAEQRETAECLRTIAPISVRPPEPNVFAEVFRGFFGGSMQDGGTPGREIGHALSGFFLVGDVRDLGANALRGRWGDAGVDVLGLVPLAGDGFKAAKRADALRDAARSAERAGRAPSPRSPLSRAGLRQDLVIQSLHASFHAKELPVARVMERGEGIRDLPRLLATYGGKPDDWVKVTSRDVPLDGVNYQGHWYLNERTGQTDDFKVIPPERRR